MPRDRNPGSKRPASVPAARGAEHRHSPASVPAARGAQYRHSPPSVPADRPAETPAASEGGRQFLPALRFRWLTGVYDRLFQLFFRERKRRGRFVRQVSPQPGDRILDVGCGTGSLALMLAEAQSQATVVGLDPDLDILALARRKARGTGSRVAFCAAFADTLPFRPASFDRVVSSLVFHHLPTTVKERALHEICTALRPGGELHVQDWGRPVNRRQRAAFFSVQLLDGFETTDDNVRGRLPGMMAEAGFDGAAETWRTKTFLGTLSSYRGRRPAAEGEATSPPTVSQGAT